LAVAVREVGVVVVVVAACRGDIVSLTLVRRADGKVELRVVPLVGEVEGKGVLEPWRR
jgi:hypothetical protein